MVQMLDPFRKELVSCHRQLMEQEHELRDIRNKTNRNDRAGETLELRMRIRQTQQRINSIRAHMNGLASAGQDTRGPITPNSPETIPLPDHPHPPDPPYTHHKGAT